MIIDSEEKILTLYSEENWSMSKLGRESDFSYSKVRNIIIESEEVEKRSHKEACNTKEFKESLREANEGSTLSEEHRESISEGVKKSNSNQDYWKGKCKKSVSDKKIIKLYYEYDENAKRVSEDVDLTPNSVRNRLRRNGVDTSQDEPWNKGKKLDDEHKKKLSEAKKGKSWEEIFGEEHAEWRRDNIGEKISEAKEGHDVSRETRRKLRLKRIKQIEKAEKEGGQVHPNYNKDGCEFIERFGEENNFDFQHAENGGEYFINELGYWVDGYDKDNNIVVEYDEPCHFENGFLKESDKKRMREIIDHLNCRFIRVDSRNNKVYIDKSK